MTSTELVEIQLNDRMLSFTLRRSPRRSLAITVFPDETVLVSAPNAVSTSDVQSRVKRRASWIFRVQREFASFRPRATDRRYVQGETHRFLGRQLRLSVEGEGARRVAIEGGQIVVRGTDRRDRDGIERAVRAWYQRQARAIFLERVEACLRRFPESSATPPNVMVRRLTRRWGSMSRDGRTLMLNTRLVEAGSGLIDYVIVHELCHVEHPNHGVEFFDLLEKKLPDWSQRKARLERLLA